MKKSKAETTETRRRIVEMAARELREKGIQATGLADVMAAAGLTHGGFYRHFGSKDQLVTEACGQGMESLVEKAEAASSRCGGKSTFEAIVGSYLDPKHRDDRADGCPLAGLGSELARSTEETRAAVSIGLLRLVGLLTKQSRRRKREAAKSDALFAVSALVGAVTLSRIVIDPQLSTAILSATKNHLAEARRAGVSRRLGR